MTNTIPTNTKAFFEKMGMPIHIVGIEETPLVWLDDNPYGLSVYKTPSFVNRLVIARQGNKNIQTTYSLRDGMWNKEMKNRSYITQAGNTNAVIDVLKKEGFNEEDYANVMAEKIDKPWHQHMGLHFIDKMEETGFLVPAKQSNMYVPGPCAIIRIRWRAGNLALGHRINGDDRNFILFYKSESGWQELVTIGEVYNRASPHDFKYLARFPEDNSKKVYTIAEGIKWAINDMLSTGSFTAHQALPLLGSIDSGPKEDNNLLDFVDIEQGF